ncbi:hypothetical protein INS49_000252 [Diaporthe citri]|uniref:uncharacterized protein n=1 Tax=Diaporthe citri TaxID=83186 RepID=UPI001C7EE2AA|nr:uncharacterized protein INS49_000252 [Diaporthe citri]KAG6366076.1 hypothetical protein INS49_000252 [Diaporthe citri]
MKSIWVTAVTLAAGMLGSPLAAAGPQLQTEKRQIGNVSTVLPDLLREIQSQTGAIDDILDLHPGPITGDVAKQVANVVGAHFGNITGALRAAHLDLKQLSNDTQLVDEVGNPCDVTCIVDKTKGVVGHAGATTRKSLLKLGLHLVGKHVSPFFLALSGIVLTLNTLVGGALAAVAAFVNGVGLAIAAGLAYLGHLVSEREKMRAGGPNGHLTKVIGDIIGDTVVAKLGL